MSVIHTIENAKMASIFELFIVRSNIFHVIEKLIRTANELI